MIHTATAAAAFLDGIDRDAPDWTGALCREFDPDWWFPGDGETAPEAIEVCERCPLLDACREYATARPRLEGIWGGLSKRQRERLRAMRRGSETMPHGTLTGYRMHHRYGIPLCTECIETRRKSRQAGESA